MAQGIAAGVSEGSLPEPRNASALRAWSAYLVPLLLTAIALPLTIYSGYQSTTWLGTRFPGFLLMENAVVPTVSGFDWPPDRAAFFHAQVVAVDGRAVHRSDDVFDYLATLPPGTAVSYTLVRDDRSFVRQLPVRVFGVEDLLQTYGIIFLFGCANLAIGLVVGFLQPRTAQGRVFAFHTFVAAMYAITSVFLHHPGFHVLSRLCLLIECTVWATFVHLAMTFPVTRGGGTRRRALLLAGYVFSLLLFIVAGRGFDASPPNLDAVHFAYALTAFGLVCVACSMAFAYLEKGAPRVRLQIKAVLPGVLLACAAPFLVFLNNATGARDLPMQSGLLAALPFYASIAYAIAKHDLFDIDRVVRLSFVYAVVTVVVLGAYALMMQLGAWLLPVSGDHSSILGGVFLLLLAAGLAPLRRGVQSIVDRAFYRQRLDYRATIRELSEVMATLLDLREIVTQVTQRVAAALQLESIAIVLFDGDDQPPGLWRASGSELPSQNVAPEAVALAAVLQRQPAIYDPRVLLDRVPPALSASLRDFLERTGTAGLIALAFRGRITGALLLGPKRSGLPLDSEAIDLLRTLANQTAIALENARSYDELEELNRSLDAKVQQQTEELRASNTELSHAYDELKSAQAQLVQSEKMASLGQLVAGVAHELNNPASFVHGGLANLAEYLSRFVQVLEAYEQAPLADQERAEAIAQLRKRLRLDYLLRETPELLRVCFEGSERITRIVEDLRVFARADSGQRVPVQLSEGIESTLRLLTSRLTERDIEVERRYETVPDVHADAGQLNQVWMNLLSNAIDAVQESPSPRITIAIRHAAADGAVEVEVRDNGAGMAADIQTRIFDPFFSTKPIGKGTGLGLAIAYGAVKSHGGTITVDSELDRGTALVVRLPVGPEWRA